MDITRKYNYPKYINIHVHKSETSNTPDITIYMYITRYICIFTFIIAYVEEITLLFLC